MVELKSETARAVAEIVKGKQGLEPVLAGLAAGVVARSFGVEPEEVAILCLSPKRDSLKFVVPEKLARVGTIPMSSTTSLAVRTARSGRAECINNFASAKHQTTFEAIRLGDERSGPIQKIMSAPILVEGSPVGALQVSRKGKTAAAAGADFTSDDMASVKEIAAALALCFQPS